jgi:TolB-like protein
MAILKLQILGGFLAQHDSGVEVVIQSKKGRALLAIVSLAPPGGMGREKLAALLWSDRGEDQARSSLRQLLTVLRKELGPNLLSADDIKVDLSRSNVEVDALKLVEIAQADDVVSLRHAAGLYKGELLADLSVNDPAFDDWLRRERNRFDNLMLQVFDRLLPLEPPAERVTIARRLVAIDPLRETSNMALMQALAAAGERAQALQHFAIFRELLKTELNIQPGPDIERFQSQLAAQGIAPSQRQLAEQTAKPGHERPSIAVLTFANLSSDPNQRYFSDGITADIVTELSRFHQLQVHTKRLSTGGERPIADAAMTGRELGVQYVVEGSVRRMGSRVRITAQLIDSASEENVWAERFDANEDDIFSMQDQIVRSIAAQLVGRLRIANLAKALRKPPSSMAAYDYVLRGDSMQIGTPEAEAQALHLFRKAVELDPGYARAYAHIANHLTLQWARDFSLPDGSLDEPLEFAKKAVELDGEDEFCQSSLAYVYMQRNAHDLAKYHNLKALTINPNSPALLAATGILYGFRGEAARSLAYFDDALTINPHFLPSWYWRNRAVVHFDMRNYEVAISAFSRSPIMPDWVETYLAAAYAQLGLLEDARQHREKALALTPTQGIRAIMSRSPYLRKEDAEHLENAMRKAGFND